MNLSFLHQQSIKRKIGILKANKQEMSGSIAQLAEQSAVNRFVVGSSPSVPVFGSQTAKTLRENMCHWFDSNHSDFWSVAQLVGQCENLMRTVKKLKTYVHALTAINLVKKILQKFLNGSNP